MMPIVTIPSSEPSVLTLPTAYQAAIHCIVIVVFVNPLPATSSLGCLQGAVIVMLTTNLKRPKRSKTEFLLPVLFLADTGIHVLLYTCIISITRKWQIRG